MIISQTTNRPLSVTPWVKPIWFAHLNQITHHALTFLKAPSGVGKTMALSQWVKDQQHSWLTLNWASNDFPLFYRDFISAWINAPESLREMGHWQQLPPVFEVSKLVRQALENAPAQIFVFDRIDMLYHASTCGFLNQLLQGLPDHIHFVFSGSYLPGQFSFNALKTTAKYVEIQPNTDPYMPGQWPEPLLSLIQALPFVDEISESLGKTLHAELWQSAVSWLKINQNLTKVCAIQAPKAWMTQFNTHLEDTLISMGCETLVQEGEFSKALGVSLHHKRNLTGVFRQGISQHVLNGCTASAIKWFESLAQEELLACSDLCVAYAEALVREEKYMPAFTWMKRCEMSPQFELRPQEMGQWLNLEANLAFVQGEYANVVHKATKALNCPLTENMSATSAFNQGIGHFYLGDLNQAKLAFQSCFKALYAQSNVYAAQDTQFLVAYIQLLKGDIQEAEHTLVSLQNDLDVLNLTHEVAFKTLLFRQWIKNLKGDDIQLDELIQSTLAAKTYPLDLSLLCELLWRTGQPELIRRVLPENGSPPLMTWHIILEGDADYYKEFTFYQDWHWKSIFDAFGLFRAAQIFKTPQKVKPLLDYLLAFSIQHQGHYMSHELLTWQSILGLEYDKNRLTKMQNHTLLPTFLNQC